MKQITQQERGFDSQHYIPSTETWKDTREMDTILFF